MAKVKDMPLSDYRATIYILYIACADHRRNPESYSRLRSSPDRSPSRVS
jgi:hypothetical protein